MYISSFRENSANFPQAALRKLNDFIKRARLCRVLSLVVGELAANMPLIGKDAKKKNLLKNLEEIVQTVEQKHGIIVGDLPAIDKLKTALQKADWSKFKQVKH